MQLLLPLICSWAVSGSPSPKKRPSGVYYENSTKYIMQAVITSPSMAKLQFVMKAEKIVINMPDVPYLFHESNSTFTIFPRKTSESHPLVQLMAGMVGRAMDFPAVGKWHPEDDLIVVDFNDKKWDMAKIADEKDLVVEACPEGDCEVAYFGYLSIPQVAKLVKTPSAPAQAAESFVVRTDETVAAAPSAKDFIRGAPYALCIIITLITLIAA